MAGKRKRESEPSRCSERLQVAKAAKISEEEAAIKAGTKKPKRFRRPRQRKSCKFLQLPGEIRNDIYRLALVKKDAITVTPEGPGEPSLLRVCKSIRNDTRSIYYGENRFHLQIKNFNGADFGKFAQQYNMYEFAASIGRPAGSIESNIVFRMTGLPNWDNLVKWVKASRTTRLIPNLEDDDDDSFTHSDSVLKAAFRLKQTVGWFQLDKALETMRIALDGTHSPWAARPCDHRW